jgi:hypothetical protein
VSGPTQVPAPPPQGSELLTDFLPVDRSCLADAVDRFLDEFEGLGAELADWPSSTSVLPALAALTLAAVASNLARRQSSAGPTTAAEAEDDERLARSPGFPGAWNLAET